MVASDADALGLESREPSVEDLERLCANLNEVGARHLILGGFAMRAAGYDRRTMDIDILVDAGLDNEARVIAALSRLPFRSCPRLLRGSLGGRAADAGFVPASAPHR